MNLHPIMQSVQAWLQAELAMLNATSAGEIVLATALPLLAILISIQINRFIDRQPNRTLYAKVIDFTAPLISPVLAIIFTAAALGALTEENYHPILLAFSFKICVAWLAVHIVIILTSGTRTASLFIGLVIIPITLLHLFGIWKPLTAFARELEFSIGNITINLFQILQAAVVLTLLFAITGFVMNLTEQRLKRIRNMRASSRTLILKFTQIVLYLIVFFIGMQTLGISLAALSIFGGALGVGIGFGLQKIASNFISGIILLFERAIEIGDIIEVEPGVTGVVKHTSGRYTLVELPDNKDMLIPNEEFITQRVTSLTHGSTRGRVEIAVGVDYNDDVTLALKLLVQAAQSVPRCMADPAPASFITALGESSINLVLYFWVENVNEGRLQPKTEAILAILKLFKKNSITIPYPHQVQIADPAMEERIEELNARLESATKPRKKDPA